MRSRRSPFDDLEPGTLRDELFAQEVAAERDEQRRRDEEQAALRARQGSQPLVFTGNGAEYFRIWIVNLALTVATLGIYSAWAKVRKTQYFWQNTQFNGHRFNYHGAPMAILRGRLLAVLLLVAYTWSFAITRTVGVATLLLLCLLAPWLFLRAQEFKLRNTSYAGLRFAFDLHLRTTYPRLLLLPLLWFIATFAGFFFELRPGGLAAIGMVPLLLFPWMHHSLKRLQHSRASFGSLPARFTPCLGEFYATYALVVFAAIVALVGLIVIAMLATPPIIVVARPLGFELLAIDVMIGASMLGGVVAYVMAFPLAAARIQRSVWAHTQLGPLWFHTVIDSGTYFRLVAKCAVLTVLTLGLYWPYAAVRLARYRIECLEVRGDQAPPVVAARAAGSHRAAGDSAADLFGVDIGL
ncbi:MAG: YjgN family protein [Gemmatimonas sp.]